MWPNPLRLALPERVGEGKEAGQPTRDPNSLLEHKSPEFSGTEETLGSPTPKGTTAEEANKMPGPGKHIPADFWCTRLSPVQVDRHTLRRNPNLRLKNQSTPTTTDRILAIPLTRKVRGIDDTGRPPEFASRWLFHVPSSSIRGSPGSFAVFFILGDFVGICGFFGVFLFFSFIFMWGSLTPDVHLHIHGLLVSFNVFYIADRALLGKFHPVRSLLVLFPLRPRLSHHRHSSHFLLLCRVSGLLFFL